ncbi:hypothetical protein ACJX0J_014944, partial [Zea mays]
VTTAVVKATRGIKIEEYVQWIWMILVLEMMMQMCQGIGGDGSHGKKALNLQMILSMFYERDELNKLLLSNIEHNLMARTAKKTLLEGRLGGILLGWALVEVYGPAQVDKKEQFLSELKLDSVSDHRIGLELGAIHLWRGGIGWAKNTLDGLDKKTESLI